MSDETMKCGHKEHRYGVVPRCLDCATNNRDELDRLRAENEALRARIAEFDKSIMAESRDPNGTIWEVANQFLARAKAAEVKLAALEGQKDAYIKIISDLEAKVLSLTKERDECGKLAAEYAVRKEKEIAALTERVKELEDEANGSRFNLKRLQNETIESALRLGEMGREKDSLTARLALAEGVVEAAKLSDKYRGKTVENDHVSGRCRCDPPANFTDPDCAIDRGISQALSRLAAPYDVDREVAELREMIAAPEGKPCCDGENPEHPSCFAGNDPIGKLKAAERYCPPSPGKADDRLRWLRSKKELSEGEIEQCAEIVRKYPKRRFVCKFE